MDFYGAIEEIQEAFYREKDEAGMQKTADVNSVASVQFHPPPELGHVLLFKNLYLKQYFFPSIFNKSLHKSKMKSLEKLTYIYIHKYLLKQNS